jgi:[ribosomal protein S18]-alanine N-acetyltransferase
MKIIRVSITHSELLSQMHGKCFDKAWSKEDFEKLLANKFNQVIMIAGEDGDMAVPMGFIMYQEVEKEKEIITICTLPKYRKQGVAKALVETLDADKIFLDVDEENLPAVNLYKKLGFDVERIRDKYYENGHNALIMTKTPRREIK